MKQLRGNNRPRQLTWLLVAVCLPLALALSLPRLLAGLHQDQFRLNPNVSLRADEQYRLALWLERPHLPDGDSWQQGLEQALAEFSLLYPQVEVKLTHLTPDDVAQRMNEALTTGTPPDLFFSANRPAPNFGQLQLPLARYLDKTERAVWPDAVWNQLQRADKLAYDLPIAAYRRVFLVNQALLPDGSAAVAQVREQGWTWPELIQLAEAATSSKVWGFTPTSTDQSLLKHWAASLGKPAPYDQDGNLLWTEADLIELAKTWLSLQASHAVPRKGSEMDVNCLESFLKQKTAILGPLNHRLAAWLWPAATGKGIQAALVPSPSVLPGGDQDISLLSISLFRQEPYQGDRQAKAAAELAKFLAPKLGDLLQDLTGALPVTTASAEPAECIPFDPASFAVYADLSHTPAAAYNYGPLLGSQEMHWQLTITPAWNKLVAGQFTAEQFAEAVLRELAVATIAGP